MRFGEWILISGLLTGAVVSPLFGEDASKSSVVATYGRSAGPTAAKLAMAFGQSKKDEEGTGGGLLGPDAQACIINFVSYTAPFNALVAQQWPTTPVAGELAQIYREKSTGGVFALGERRLAVVVNASNSINTIRITSLHQILAALEGDPFYQDDKTRMREKEWPLLYGIPAVWNEFGWDSLAPVRVYSEGRSSWTAETLGVRCLKRIEWSLGSYRWGQRPLRKDLVECIDADDVVKRVRRDPAGIGFVQYTGQRIKGVKILAVEDDFPDGWPADFANPGPLLPIRPDGTVDFSAWNTPAAKRPTGPIAMKLGKVLQPEYPLSEPLLLFVHPQAPQNVKDFAAWCVSEPGANIAETLGLITPFADAQTKAQQRLADLRAGKGEILTACGQGSLYYLARDLTLAFTRSTRPVELKYEPETTDRLATLFLQGRHSILLSWGPVGPASAGHPSPQSAIGNGQSEIPPPPKPGSLAAQWQDLERKGLRSYTIGARVAAVIVNAKTGKTSLTPSELSMVLSGQVRDWRALNVPDGQLKDNTIQLFMPATKNPISQLTYQRLGLTSAGPTQRLDDDAQILAAISMNDNAIGIVNATSLPATPAPAPTPAQRAGDVSPPVLPSHPKPTLPTKPTKKAQPPQDPLTKQGLTVLAIVAQDGKSTQPRPEAVFAGQYPLTEFLIAYLSSTAPPTASEVFLQSLATPSAQEAMKTQGITPIPPAPAR